MSYYYLIDEIRDSGIRELKHDPGIQTKKRKKGKK
jgi:hypothetical protein